MVMFLAMEMNTNLNAMPHLQKLRSNSSGECIFHAILQSSSCKCQIKKMQEIRRLETVRKGRPRSREDRQSPAEAFPAISIVPTFCCFS